MALGSTQQRVKLRLLVVVVLVVVVVWWWWLAMAAGLGDNGQLTSISLLRMVQMHQEFCKYGVKSI